MNRNTVRLNITLPFSLVSSLDTIAGHRQRSRFIAQAVHEKIEHLKNEKMNALLQEGYQSQQLESIAIVRDFDGSTDRENPESEN